MKKLTKALATDLVDVLNAQSGAKRIDDTAVYNAKLKKVGDFLNVAEDGTPNGGVKQEVLDANPANKELAKASADHLEKGEARIAKKAAKEVAKEAKKEKPAPTDKEYAAAIVRFVKAITKVERIPEEEYATVSGLAMNFLDHKKGGIKNTAAKGKKTPWERFKGEPGVKEAGEAHIAHIKTKKKAKELETAPNPEI